MKGVSLVGCGAIGSVIARAIDSGLVEAELRYVMDVDSSKAEKLVQGLTRQRPRIALSVDEIAADPLTQVVVEAASQDAVLQHGQRLLEAGKELVVLSVGALLRPEAKQLLERYSGRVHVPSGAIAGLDAVRAMALAGIEEVVLLTRKHPEKLADEPYVRESGLKLRQLDQPMVVFEGSAEEAVVYFPRTLNVAATLSLYAGTPARVRVVADPNVDRNVHEVLVKSKAGTLYVRVENVPHPQNPKTSFLAALSAVELLREICSKL